MRQILSYTEISTVSEKRINLMKQTKIMTDYENEFSN
jgi:hypothetical protein